MPVRILPLEERHLDRVHEWLADGDLRDLIGTVHPFSRSQHRQWYEALQADRSRLAFAVEEAGSGRHLGVVGLSHLDLYSRSAELWIYLGAEADRGRHHGREAAGQLLRFAFETLGLNRVYVNVFAYNERALRFFQALGLTAEGVQREAVFRRGRFHDKHLLGILAREFAGGR